MPKPNTIDLIEFPAASADELQKITGFFSSVFGWNYKAWGDTYHDTTDSGTPMGVNGETEQGQPTMPMVVLYVEDLEATKQKVEQSGGKILVDIYAFPGGRRFHFTDPAGHELAAWSE